ncbi:MAG: glycosyltransferase [Pseudorhodoplanes sp.]|nr:glycosyltransferase [Pseudorhodoplanes sp.]
MASADRPLKILHVFRAPIGGLFRHVLDLVKGQSARGHSVGIIADSLTGGDFADKEFSGIRASLALGLNRIPMARQVGLGDITATLQVRRLIGQLAPNVVHGHGAKGAAYARLAAPRHGPVRVYTPHGGSLHFPDSALSGRIYIAMEKVLRPLTDLFLFESAYIARLYGERVGATEGIGIARIVHNGVSEQEGSNVETAPDATDLVYIGEMRELKGVHLLLDAIATLRQSGLPLTATLVGDGPDRDALKAQSARLGLDGAVRFLMPMPARKAFALGRILVVPSLGESLPYIVLEAAAAARPLVATNVGGIPEIFGPQAYLLIAPNDIRALMGAIANAINDPETMQAAARTLQSRIKSDFSIRRMVDSGLAAYREAIRAKH